MTRDWKQNRTSPFVVLNLFQDLCLMSVKVLKRISNDRFRCETANKGFTLLELLIVLVIIGVVVAAATLVIKRTDRNQGAHSAVNILRARMLLVEQKAILQATTLGLAFSQNGYQFYRLQNNLLTGKSRWERITNEKTLAFQAWSGNFTINLSLPHQQNVLVPNQLPENAVIIFNSSGGITPFTLTLGAYHLKASENGEINIK